MHAITEAQRGSVTYPHSPSAADLGFELRQTSKPVPKPHTLGVRQVLAIMTITTAITSRAPALHQACAGCFVNILVSFLQEPHKSFLL